MRRKIIVACCIVLILGIGGCANTIPVMTAEEEAQIVNYAAGVALKYDASYENRLVELPLYEEEEKTELPEKETETDKGMDPVEDTETVDASEKTNFHSSVEEFFGAGAAVVKFCNAYYTDSYPMDSVEQYFSLNASAGKKLLVMVFEVTNPTENKIDLDFFQTGAKMSVAVNNEKAVSILSTMLTDDLATFTGSLNASEKICLVLLAEVGEDKANEIESLVLSLKNESSTAKILLK